LGEGGMKGEGRERERHSKLPLMLMINNKNIFNSMIKVS
jgi:hypothetical protein